MLAAVLQRLLPTACALGLLAAGTGASPAAAADWKVSRWAPVIAGASLGSKDRRFSLSLSCRPDSDKRISHHLFLFVPRGWAALSETLRVTIDGVPFTLEVGGSEDGVSLSDVIFGNSYGASRDLARALLSAREIVIDGPRQRGRIPSSTVFEAGGSPQPNEALDRLCTPLGAWATPSGAASAVAAAAAAPPPPAPAAAPAKITANRYVFDAIKKEPWRTTWRGLTERSPKWLKTLSGPAGASTVEVIDGEAFEHFDICMAHACDEANAEFLFSADGLRGYGLVVDRSGVSWLGSPPPAVASRLAAHFPEGRRPALPPAPAAAPAAPAIPPAPMPSVPPSVPRIVVPPMTPLAAPPPAQATSP